MYLSLFSSKRVPFCTVLLNQIAKLVHFVASFLMTIVDLLMRVATVIIINTPLLSGIMIGLSHSSLNVASCVVFLVTDSTGSSESQCGVSSIDSSIVVVF